MLQPAEVKQWTLTVVTEMLAQVEADGLGNSCDCSLYDDQPGSSPGRLTSFEIAKGKLLWWAWRTQDVCDRAEWPLKLVCSWGEGENRSAWIQERTWRLTKADQKVRSVRL